MHNLIVKDEPKENRICLVCWNNAALQNVYKGATTAQKLEGLIHGKRRPWAANIMGIWDWALNEVQGQSSWSEVRPEADAILADDTHIVAVKL